MSMVLTILFVFQPPICENGINLIRKKRQVVEIDESDNSYNIEDTPEAIKVYSGLYVNEAQDLDDDAVFDDELDVNVVRNWCFHTVPYSNVNYFQRAYDPNTFCISQRSFAIGIAIAGLILMTAVVVAIMILVSKRRRKNLSTTGSSIYSGPYTNTAYSHSSISRRS